MRAQWFATSAETDWLQTVTREVKAVRSSVGVCDVSTLGKIDIQGPDAGVFLDRVYTNMFSSLAVGKVRYGLMLREDGLVLDDGTSALFAQDHYVMSTTTANAARVMQHLEYARQVLWPQLDVQIVSVTEQWAQYSIAGPNSRLLLQRLLGSAIDLNDAAFAYQACAQVTWQGMTVRVFRISFSGELAYEIAVPARYGDTLVRSIMSVGTPWNVTPYGSLLDPAAVRSWSARRFEQGCAFGSASFGLHNRRGCCDYCGAYGCHAVAPGGWNGRGACL